MVACTVHQDRSQKLYVPVALRPRCFSIPGKGDDLVALCEGIALQKDPNSIIIYADHFFPGDDFLDKLVHKGIHNIIANYPDVDEKTNVTKMMEDLKECLTTGLSRQKWRKYDKSFDAFAEAREAALIAEKESEKPRYSQASLHIAVVGAQSRIGTTSFARIFPQPRRRKRGRMRQQARSRAARNDGNLL